ncbi:hypothetical protein CBM2633_P100005 [Cupriavidus taiwanensis]|nr:hypothetical protein CBM2585_P100005 [Cupriavidus taiwanensis]SOZ75535.1 hypothetical protein CBM2617_P110005 [Cupriavidus taiwanensis]SOZ96112.1 hypothetical protein CBM2621_P110005 [Cupriavidus taiwanensis]SPA23134.1 hypothetical protein CBM2633_P100005 [Cupriavidus taiwanensis]SPA35116.1 hypothetical protein CBM2637_P110005 [Cupriavidus taiwanensis]
MQYGNLPGSRYQWCPCLQSATVIGGAGNEYNCALAAEKSAARMHAQRILFINQSRS